MWVVRSLCHEDLGHYEYSYNIRCFRHVIVYNTETGETRTLQNNAAQTALVDALTELSPYGYFREVGEVGLTMTIDDLSLQMLSYIDEVEGIHIPSYSGIWEFLSHLPICSASFIDMEKTIVVPNREPFTIFNFMLMYKVGWHEDFFYFYKGKVSALVGCAYRVSFNDVQAAKRLFVKAQFLQRKG